MAEPEHLQTEASDLVKRHNLTNEAVTRKCTYPHSQYFAKFISWDSVGCRLKGITAKHISDIQTDGTDEAKRRRILMQKWAEVEGDKATYLELIVAMLKAEKLNEATLVCKLLSRKSKHCTPDPPSLVPRPHPQGKGSGCFWRFLLHI